LGVGVRVAGDGVLGRRKRGEERRGHTYKHTYIRTYGHTERQGNAR
jgi:hypothetical protein